MRELLVRAAIAVSLFVGASACSSARLDAREPDRVIDLWPGVAPGETTRSTGEPLPRRPNEDPPATRIKGITRPQLMMFAPPVKRRSGAAVLIFPGGGYNYVVADKEGSEAAEWLNRLGITAFVVHYRTKPNAAASADRPASSRHTALPPLSERPLQDGQRAISLVRQHAEEWGIDADRIGILGFSAGGQVAALIATRFEERSYELQDAVDGTSCRPDFSLLIYPWRIIDDQTGKLLSSVTVTKNTPPTFLVHAHDDSASSLSSIMMYIALKQHGIDAELHIYGNGGHGYGMRSVAGSDVDTWPGRAEDWLRSQGMIYVE